MSLSAGLYIHIPFCIRKCPYCDFYSISDLSMVSAFADALGGEMRMWDQEGSFAGLEFDTLYIGGGTPTIMDSRSLAGIVEAARKNFPVRENAEITIEANPAAITRNQLTELRLAGINRINLGIQSFDDANLAFLGRIHSAADCLEAISMAEKSGFDNIGIDFIYALPGQSPENWQKELEQALCMTPAHISAYMLTIEPETAMDEARIAGRFKPASNAMQGEMFLTAGRMMAANGYDHYEISNFAKSPKHRSRHNSKYWNNHPYLGLGPAAHSYIPPRRMGNIKSVRRYIRRIQAGKSPVEESESLDVRQQMIEALYLGLRQADGIDYDTFNSRFQTDFLSVFSDIVERFASDGLLTADGGGCRLTLNGMLMQESIAAAFIDRL